MFTLTQLRAAGEAVLASSLVAGVRKGLTSHAPFTVLVSIDHMERGEVEWDMATNASDFPL